MEKVLKYKKFRTQFLNFIYIMATNFIGNEMSMNFLFPLFLSLRRNKQ